MSVRGWRHLELVVPGRGRRNVSPFVDKIEVLLLLLLLLLVEVVIAGDDRILVVARRFRREVLS
jgi:predicted metalloenzyme YecM